MHLGYFGSQCQLTSSVASSSLDTKQNHQTTIDAAVQTVINGQTRPASLELLHAWLVFGFANVSLIAHLKSRCEDDSIKIKGYHAYSVNEDIYSS